MPNGRQHVFFSYRGKRYTCRLGLVSVADAEEFRAKLDLLIKTRNLSQMLAPELSAWERGLSDPPRGTLVTAGLVEANIRRSIEDLITADEKQWKARGNKRSTLEAHQPVWRNLRTHFKKKDIRRLTPDDADEFRLYLTERGRINGGKLAKGTVTKRCKTAREIFEIAVRKKWIEENPFGQRPQKTPRDTSRDVYVSGKTIEKLIAGSGDPEFRLLLAMARYFGLRGISEIHALEWSWVDWAANTISILAPKTEHHDGQGWRQVPIFPEVAPHLDAAWEAAHKGQKLIFPNQQSTNAAITGKIHRLCHRLGIPTWPRMFVNLRASCERDLLRQHPIDDVTAWLGHSAATALTHYSRVVKDQSTASVASALRAENPKSSAKRNAKRADLPPEHFSEAGGKKKRAFSASVRQRPKVAGPQGLEPRLTEPESVVLPITLGAKNVMKRTVNIADSAPWFNPGC